MLNGLKKLKPGFRFPIRKMSVKPKEAKGETTCQYCVKDGDFYPIEFTFGIYACADHNLLAERDRKAWMHEAGIVMWSDATKDPMFKELGLIQYPILVRRSSGAIEGDWMLMKPSLCNMAHLKRSRACGKWYMMAIQDYTDSERPILVEDLKLSLIDERQHGLVDAFIARLEAGFYKTD